AVERGANDANALLLVFLDSDVIAAEPDDGDFLARAAQSSPGHRAARGFRSPQGYVCSNRRGHAHFQAKFEQCTAGHAGFVPKRSLVMAVVVAPAVALVGVH